MGYHPFSLDVHEGFLYWSDWAKNAILRVSKIDGGGEEVIVDGLVDKPMGLKILHPRAGQPGMKVNGIHNIHLCIASNYLQ